MARESKRKRDERRFGRPERLADLVIASEPERWRVSPFDPHATLADLRPVVQQIRADLATATVIVADNVGAFYFDTKQDEWRYDADFPNSSPPFPRFWVEMALQSVITIGGKRHHVPGFKPGRFGWLFDVADARKGMLFPDVDRVTGQVSPVELPEARWFLQSTFVCGTDAPIFQNAHRWFAVDGSGRIIRGPHCSFGGDARLIPGGSHQEAFGCFFAPALLALSFMHCKNVSLSPVEPDAKLNRQRKRAGLRPFVRYHTINIEPMKRVLRIEGDVESNGLKKALHICRGHFATYTEDRPLFGRSVGTFWRPSHVRGSISQGLVVSDYNVHPPEAPRP